MRSAAPRLESLPVDLSPFWRCAAATRLQHRAAGVDVSHHSHAARAGTKMADFRKLLVDGTPDNIQQLGHAVEDFAKQFPTIGFDKAEMRYTH
jgi:hypothetical protein